MLQRSAARSSQYLGPFEITKVRAILQHARAEIILRITLGVPALAAFALERDRAIRTKTSVLKSWSRPLFITLIAGSLAIWWNALFALFSLAFADERYTHILLIVPISAALIWLELRPFSNLPDSVPVWGIAILIVFLMLALLVNIGLRRNVDAGSDLKLAANIFALVVWWTAAFFLCFGARGFRRALFPLGFMVWMVPLPEFVVNFTVDFLQRGSAIAAHLLFLAARIPVAQRGMLIHIPGLTMEVAPECSSIRSSFMLLVTTMMLAHLLLRTPWKNALVVAIAIPLSIAKNGLRIFVLGLLATRVDRSYLTGSLHREGGIIYFLIALAAIFLLIRILQRDEANKPEPESAG
jgi:exosortase